jgi:hypothetical protein
MPNDVNSRGVSAVTSFVLFLALLEIAYTNATYQGAFGSIPINIAAAVIALALFVKLASAVGVNNRLVNGFDKVLAVVPVLCLAVFAYRALDYWRDGVSGFMASLAIAGGVGAVVFGMADTVVSWTGSKYEQAQHSAHDFAVRAERARQALHGDI